MVDMDKGSFVVLRSLLLQESGLDLAFYKRDFVLRCLHNRMGRMRIRTAAGYLEYLGLHREEARMLKDALSIYHTQFIRDPEKYRVLKEELLPLLLNRARRYPGSSREGSGGGIRIWSAGCAGGEEPYSVAMTVLDVLDRRTDRPGVEIIATDICERLIEKARAGRYDAAEIAKKGLPGGYVERYFERNGGSYEVRENVRRMVSFGVSDLLLEPGIPGCDIIFCRNVLIYFTPEAAREILAKFHESLNEGGYLILGNSEVLEDCFSCRYRKLKSGGEFYYRKITEGTAEHREAVERRNSIAAALGNIPS